MPFMSFSQETDEIYSTALRTHAWLRCTQKLLTVSTT